MGNKMAYKKIGMDKPVYVFILVFAILFSYTILNHFPPEQKIDTIDYEPIYYYNEETIENNTDNGTVLEPISVNTK